MRVLTTKQLADFYGVDQRTISNNYTRNKTKYIEGKHYILLEGKKLTEFREQISNLYLENFEVQTPASDNLSPCGAVKDNLYIQNLDVQTSVLINLMNTNENNLLTEPLTICLPVEISSKTRRFYLWTERGALLHAKSINTDKAWDVYEQLLDTYFRAQEMFAAENDSPVSQMSLPKVPNWHSINYKRIDNLCSVLGIDRKHMYHLILLRCSESYDLNEAKKMYKKERGFAPQYAIDIVGYFPELKEIADDYLQELEQLYKGRMTP